MKKLVILASLFGSILLASGGMDFLRKNESVLAETEAKINKTISMQNIKKSSKNVDENDIIFDDFETRDVEFGYDSEIIINSGEGDRKIKEYGKINEGIMPLNDIEDNDTIERASKIIDVTSGYYYSFSSNISGTICQKTGAFWRTYIDNDFFYIDTVFNGKMEIALSNIPNDCNFDLFLYKQLNSAVTKRKETSQIRRSINLGNTNEYISINITPGTYFIEVKSANETFNNSQKYNLFVKVYEEKEYYDMEYNINQGKLNGDVGAIWVSDYKPMGFYPTNKSLSISKNYYDCYDEYPIIHNLASNYKDQDLLYSVLYVWDPNVRLAISRIAQSAITLLERQQNNPWNDNGNKKVSVLIDGANIVLSLSGNLLSLGPIASVVVGLSGVALTITGALVDKFMPKSWDTNKQNFKEYMISIKDTFDCLLSSGNSEVVMLRTSYRFSDEFNWGVKRFIDLSPRYINISNIYRNDLIIAHRLDTPIMGTVKGISNLSDIESALQ